MFEIAEVGSRLSKQQFEQRLPALRVDLVNAQFDLRSAGFSTILLVMGDDRIACNEVLDRLNEWLDARHLTTEVFDTPSDEERERPRYWRYWRAMPQRGRIGIFFGGWAMYPLTSRLAGEIDDAEFDRRIEHMRALEAALAADGALIVKLWMHLPKKALEKRLKRAKARKKDSWQVEPNDWKLFETYDKSLELGERMILGTDVPYAPWRLVECSDERHRDLTVGTILRDALVARLARRDPVQVITGVLPTPQPHDDGHSALASIDLTRTIADEEYEPRLEKLQERLYKLQRRARNRELTSVLVFEGWDAAGKGGCIRRITNPLSASDYKVVPIGAPNEQERAHHYLWRFWQHLPRAGRMLIFDRSWYGRVLVERVEGFASEAEWSRAYGEINDFEAQLAEHGVLVLKFWLHIDREEQLARFDARAKTAYKKYKLTGDDYRNRSKWDDYARAADDMIARTNASHAPWHLIAANDKRAARIEVLEIVGEALREAL